MSQFLQLLPPSLSTDNLSLTFTDSSCVFQYYIIFFLVFMIIIISERGIRCYRILTRRARDQPIGKSGKKPKRNHRDTILEKQLFSEISLLVQLENFK